MDEAPVTITITDQTSLVWIDVACPGCEWPERYYNTLTFKFGCPRCDYQSDERNA